MLRGTNVDCMRIQHHLVFGVCTRHSCANSSCQKRKVFTRWHLRPLLATGPRGVLEEGLIEGLSCLGLMSSCFLCVYVMWNTQALFKFSNLSLCFAIIVCLAFQCVAAWLCLSFSWICQLFSSPFLMLTCRPPLAPCSAVLVCLFLCFPFISLLPLSLCLLLDLLFPFWFVFVSFPFSKKFSFSVLHLVKTPSSTNNHRASALSPWIIHLSTRERHHISRLTCCPLALCQKLQVYLPFLP